MSKKKAKSKIKRLTAENAALRERLEFIRGYSECMRAVVEALKPNGKIELIDHIPTKQFFKR